MRICVLLMYVCIYKYMYFLYANIYTPMYINFYPFSIYRCIQ